MNLANIQNRLYNNKWMMEKKAFFNFCNSVEDLAKLRSGGLKGMLLGDPLLLKKNEIMVPEGTQILDEKEETGDTSIISIGGAISKGPSLEEQAILGMIDVDDITNQLKTAAEDPTVNSIILCFASPGGETTGIEEAGRLIKEIDENIKPVYGWCELKMTSAAYWLGSQTRYIGMTPSSNVGGIGVYMIIPDCSEKNKMEGINIQSISSGKYKMMGHDNFPLTKEEEDILTKDVEGQHEKFKQVIKSKRTGVKDEALEGLSYEGEDALNLGLVDVVVDNFEDYLMLINKQQ